LKIAALAGGVGGAKFVDGLVAVNGAEDTAVIVNTADDFTLWGLRICPDFDTMLYTLAGIANPVQGWGIEGDTRNTLDGIATYGEDPWFLLGDRDFATHILRTAWINSGIPLGSVLYFLRRRLGVETALLPMSDDPVATRIQTPTGELAFQDYFVRRQQKDEVIGVRFEGIESARPFPQALTAVSSADLTILAPSNPIVSIGPILEVDGFKHALANRTRPAVAISPIIGGKALKGPADRMLTTLGHDSSALGVARLYQGLIDGFVIDSVDEGEKSGIEALGIAVHVTDAIMYDIPDRARLAREVVAFGQRLNVRVPA
jgi:LPPG:FO 2-phospho-L-lactate transferase